MSRASDRAGLAISDVFVAIKELELAYRVDIQIRLDVDRTVQSGRFGIASFEVYPEAVSAGARAICRYQLPLPHASSATTDGLLLRGVTTLAKMLDDYYGPYWPA